MVRPGESTTFDIVYLPRRIGRVGTVLYIHTSLGTFKYEVCNLYVYVCVCIKCFQFKLIVYFVLLSILVLECVIYCVNE